MKIKISFDREELEKWFNVDCQIVCDKCPLQGYMCDILLSKAYDEYLKQIGNEDKNNK